jgi:hypothetical protein
LYGEWGSESVAEMEVVCISQHSKRNKALPVPLFIRASGMQKIIGEVNNLHK